MSSDAVGCIGYQDPNDSPRNNGQKQREPRNTIHVQLQYDRIAVRVHRYTVHILLVLLQVSSFPYLIRFTMESPYCLAAGGYRDTIALLSFSPPTGAGTAGHIKTIAESPTPRNTSWIERSVDKPNTLYSISEDPRGKVFSLKLVAEGEQVEMQVTAVRDINGAPAHLHCLKDGSGIAVVNVSVETGLNGHS